MLEDSLSNPTGFELVRGEAPALAGARARAAVHVASVFLSASLLFLLQPMLAQLLLPIYGGSPAVWNTCLVFFQILLLAGYAYAHASGTRLGVSQQRMLHAAGLGGAVFVV